MDDPANDPRGIIRRDDERGAPMLRGLASERPDAATADSSAFYYETDTGNLYANVNNSWVLVFNATLGGKADNTEPYITVSNTTGLSAERRLIAGTGITITDNGANSSIEVASTVTSGAPDSLAYVTVGNTGSLSAERALTAGTGISITDNGANSTVVVAATGGGIPQPSTTFPGSPADGDLALIVDSTTAPTYTWLFRYESGISGSNKWHPIGAVPWATQIAASDETRASSSYGDLSTTGPTFTSPSAGEYDVQFGFEGFSGTASAFTRMNLSINAATPASAFFAETQDGTWGSAVGHQRVTIATAGHTIKAQYLCTSGTGHFYGRWMRVNPVLVAG